MTVPVSDVILGLDPRIIRRGDPRVKPEDDGVPEDDGAMNGIRREEAA